MSKVVEIFEVGPRDGLQNEKTNINTSDKIKLIDALSECGIKKIEVSSFVSSKWIPQLADAKYVFENITRNSSVKYTALTPNMKGLNAAKSANVDEVAVFAAASETFSKKNINCSIEESFERFYPLIFEALRQNIPVRGYISCITDCPYEGKIEPSAVLKVARKLLLALNNWESWRKGELLNHLEIKNIYEYLGSNVLEGFRKGKTLHSEDK